MVNLSAWQFRRQRFAGGLTFGFRLRNLFELFGDRCHICRERFLEQLPLFNRQAFCLDPEVMAFVIRHFMGQLIDLYLPPVELPVIARNDFRLLAYQFAQFRTSWL